MCIFSMNPHTPSRGPMPKPSQPATNRRRRRRPAARHRRWKLNTVLKPQRLRLRRTPPANRAISDYMVRPSSNSNQLATFYNRP